MAMFTFVILLALFAVVFGCDLRVNKDCSSWNYRPATCPVSGTGQYTTIAVVEKFSNSACTEGESFGFSNGNIWVNQGCRAKFQIMSCQQYKIVDCSSQNYAYTECIVIGATQVSFVSVSNKKSKSDCTYGTSYGITGGSIYVRDGCRATFNVCY